MTKTDSGVLVGQRIGMLIGSEYEDLEYWVVRMRMEEEGAEVIAISSKAHEVFVGKNGQMPARSDVAAADVAADTLSALLIPGGWAPDKLRRDPAILALTAAMHAQNKVIGMICHAGWVGISAGVVAGRRATGSAGIKDDVVNAGGIWEDVPALQDGNLVWGRVVEDIPAYCKALVQALSLDSKH